FWREGRRGVTGLLRRQAACPGLSRGLVSIHDDGFGELPFAGRNAIGCRGLRHEATDRKPTNQGGGGGPRSCVKSKRVQAIAAPHEMITTFLRFEIATYRSPAAKASAAAGALQVTCTN